jgi:hypothetical protein
MNKEEFFNKIKEAERYYYKNNPCYHCGPGNGCDDCRDCADSKISHELWLKVYNLKTEYKEKFGADYDKEVEALDKAHREKIRKEKLLKEVWETCTFDEIIDAGFEYNKCSGEKLINAATEFEKPETDCEQSFIDKLSELFKNTDRKNLPWGDEIMYVITDYYSNSSLIDYFDKDELIEWLDGSIEMDMYVENEIRERELSEDVDEEYTFADYTKEVESLPNYKLKNYLCDLVMANHHISNDELMNLLKEKISL